MNYPIWEVAFGSGLLIAIISILHVFVSHFAVGGGLFLVLTELKAYRDKNDSLLEWLKRHSKFFVLVTVVFGAISGVGIWFTIGLVHPSGTSSLIHSYVWGWAMEWIFFFLEITAALLYLYGWQKVDRKTHLWLGWIYFVTAFISMVIINGILTFMLTSGKWIENYQFWTGFFNPTFFPSLLLRFTFALALAGVYALLTGTRQKDENLKATVVKWSVRWIVPAFVVLPLFAFWYINSIPDSVWQSAQGAMPTASRYANIIWIFAIITFVTALLTLIRPQKTPFILALVVFASAFVTMWAFEFIREAIRKPYIINNYLYANSIYKNPLPGDAGMTLQNIDEQGILQVAKWTQFKNVGITSENQIAIGRDIFRLQCQSCHTIDAYRGLKSAIVSKNQNFEQIYSQLTGLHNIANNVMPPFAGTDAEKSALAHFLASLNPTAGTSAKTEIVDGEVLFTNNCASCHSKTLEDPMFQSIANFDSGQISYLLSKLDSINTALGDVGMSAFQGSAGEREALAKWLKAQLSQ